MGTVTSINCYNVVSGYSDAIMKILILSLALVMQIYSFSSLVLFAVISYTCTSVLKSFQQEVQVWNSKNVKISDLGSSNLLKLWKRRLQLIWKMLECINNCFTWTFLLSLCFLFTSFVTQSFYCYRGVMSTNHYDGSKFIVDGGFFSFLIIQLSLICIPVDDREHQVFKKNNNTQI